MELQIPPSGQSIETSGGFVDMLWVHKSRTPPLSCFTNRVFSNEINIAVNRTQQNYQACMFGKALHSSTSQLRDARDWYRKSCGDRGMNHDLLWRFVDVQMRLIAPSLQSVHIMQNTCGGNL